MAFKAIPVVAAKVPATQSNFPVYIKPSALTGWGSITLAEAQSSRWYSDEAKTTELAREIVSADEIHVKVTSLTSTTIIYVDYDGIRADYAATDTYGRNAVWSGYTAVYHMSEDPSGSAPQMIDSTGNGTNLTSAGSMTSGDLVAAKIGEGIDYDGTDDVTQRTSSPTPGGGTTHTISFWVKPDSISSRKGLCGNTDGASNATSNFHIEHTSAATGRLQYWGFSGGGQLGNVLGPVGTIAAGVFSNHHFRRNGTAAAMFKNGSSVATATWGSGAMNTNHSFGIGAYGILTSFGLAFDGILDEWRYTTAVLSDNWITTEYNNQNDVADFWGTVTDAGGGGSPAFIPKVSFIG